MLQTFLYEAANCFFFFKKMFSRKGLLQKEKKKKQEREEEVSCLSVTASGNSSDTHTGAAPCSVPMCVIRPIRATLEGLEDC